MVPIGMMLDNRYEILEHIGSGGMADVYKAKCHKLNRYVAIKVLRHEYNEDEAFVRRFQAEAQATAGLTHPNIVSVYDVGRDRDIYYMVMELAEGITLKKYIRRYGRLSTRETVDFAIQIASALRAAHEHHIIHRDIKPQNIMVSESGKIMVTDFGIARAATGDTVTTSAMGSVRYLSPEQARGSISDERSDIYSLGITMYEMATGKVPFDGENTVSIALAHLHEEMTPPRCYFPDIPVSLEKVILKCCMKQPNQRYQSAAALIADLEKVFSCPDGNYVYTESLDDDCPTIIRSKEEIEKVQTAAATVLPAEEDYIEEDTGLPMYPDDHTMDFEDVDDDEHANESMQKMILTIAIGAGVIIFIILFYMIGSMLHLIPRIGAKATTTTTTQTKPVTDTQAEEKTVKVPDLYGKSKTEVEALLKKLSLKPVYKYELNVPDDRRDDKALIVTKQGVEKGTKLVRGSEVEVLMGWDPQATTQAKQVEVPALLDYTEEEAIELLKSKNLNVQKVYATSDTVAVGYIIKQSPTGGSIVDAGFTVTITISQGVGKTKVPTLYGMSKEAAEVELNKVDLFLGTVTGDYSASVGVGDVISQSVESGTQVDKGTKVSIVISLGERENFTYRGDVTVSDNPFEEGESGHVKLVLRQGDEKRTIYDRSVSSSSFPLNVNFEGMKEGDGTVVMYVDGNEYKQYSVSLTAMAN